jgi:Skp family chaperone for outer membrane proteins
MRMSSRTALAAGLCLVGLASLVDKSEGQQDAKVQKASNSPPAAKLLPPASIGSVDIEAVFKDYEKVRVSSDAFQAEVVAKQGELSKLAAEGKQEAEKLAKLTPGSPDFKKSESRITQLKAQFQAGKEQYESEFAQKESEALAALYKDIQEMVAAVAHQRKLTYVIKVQKTPVSSADPNSAMKAMSSAVVYADPTTDITPDVIYYLNNHYKQVSGGSPRPSAPATGTAPASRPSAPR